MRLVFNQCNLEIQIDEGELAGICIENPAMFRSFTENLWNQANGIDGEICLSNGDKSLKLNKDCGIVFNPYSVDVNEKKIISHIYSEIQEIVNQDYFDKRNEINSNIVSMLDKIDDRLPYSLGYSLELDVTQLLKMYGVKVEMQDTALIDRVVNYIKLSHQVLGTAVFVFVHFKDYYTAEELSRFIEMVKYEQISVLMVENVVDLEETSGEKWWIVDRDLCIIEI